MPSVIPILRGMSFAIVHRRHKVPTLQNESREVRRVAFSPTEAAQALGISRAKLYEELASGRLRSVKSGKRRLIPVGALDEWLAELPADYR
jgi:excisionase family DNA binding protein